MASDPEELLRSIERTREELALTVDTIAGRLDPKRAAKRGFGAVRDGVTSVVDGARAKMHLASDGIAAHSGTANGHGSSGQATNGQATNGHGTNGHGTPPAGETSTAGVTSAGTPATAGTAATTGAAISATLAKAAPMLRRVPRRAVGVAALVAFAAILSARRRRR